MDPLHPPSTSMVEGDHATTHINRFIGWMVTSTAAERSGWIVTLTEFTVDFYCVFLCSLHTQLLTVPEISLPRTFGLSRPP